jgi:hypothetical protein
MSGIIGNQPFGRSGVVGAFTSAGINDDATSTAITIASNGNTSTHGVLTVDSGIVADLTHNTGNATLLTYSINSTGVFSGSSALSATQAPLNSIVLIRLTTNSRSTSAGAAYIEVYGAGSGGNSMGHGLTPSSHWNIDYNMLCVPILASGDRTIHWQGDVDVVGTNNKFVVEYRGYYMLATT